MYPLKRLRNWFLFSFFILSVLLPLSDFVTDIITAVNYIDSPNIDTPVTFYLPWDEAALIGLGYTPSTVFLNDTKLNRRIRIITR
jgi:hypothetical protein